MSKVSDIYLTSGDFTLVRKVGIGVDNTPWDGLEIISKGVANKHVVDIRLNSLNYIHEELDDSGEKLPFRYIYDDNVSVYHGIRSTVDTLNETLEYAQCLELAVDFARLVQSWLRMHPEWTDRSIAKKDRLERYNKENE